MVRPNDIYNSLLQQLLQASSLTRAPPPLALVFSFLFYERPIDEGEVRTLRGEANY